MLSIPNKKKKRTPLSSLEELYYKRLYFIFINKIFKYLDKK